MNTIAAKREFSIRIMMMNWPVEQILSFGEDGKILKIVVQKKQGVQQTKAKVEYDDDGNVINEI